MRAQCIHHQSLPSGARFLLGDILAADIGCHNDHRIFEIHRSALAVGNASIIEHLEQNVKYVRVCLFDFIK